MSLSNAVAEHAHTLSHFPSVSTKFGVLMVATAYQQSVVVDRNARVVHLWTAVLLQSLQPPVLLDVRLILSGLDSGCRDLRSKGSNQTQEATSTLWIPET
jgi:hypothetical protein